MTRISKFGLESPKLDLVCTVLRSCFYYNFARIIIWVVLFWSFCFVNSWLAARLRMGWGVSFGRGLHVLLKGEIFLFFSLAASTSYCTQRLVFFRSCKIEIRLEIWKGLVTTRTLNKICHYCVSRWPLFQRFYIWGILALNHRLTLSHCCWAMRHRLPLHHRCTMWVQIISVRWRWRPSYQCCSTSLL